MFTIKHVSLNGGETLYEGSEPAFYTVGSQISPHQPAEIECGGLSYTDSRGEIKTLHGGKVYVMNESGRTVATYVLSRPATGQNLQDFTGVMGATQRIDTARVSGAFNVTE